MRFLNEVGGGVISRVGPKNLVTVRTDDGFDMPVLASECVVIEPAEARPAPRSVTAAPTAAAGKTIPSGLVSTPKPQEPAVAPQPFERHEGEKLNLMLAFVPTEPEQMQQTQFEAYFVNDSNYQIDFLWLTGKGAGWELRYRGTAEPNTKIFIDEFGYEALGSLEHSCFQLMACKTNRPFALKPAQTIRVRIDGTRFYHAGAFVSNDFFEENALLTDLVRDDKPVRTVFVDAEEMEEALMQKKRADQQPHKPAPKPKQNKDEIIEVDLHANSLLDTTAGMKNGEILNYQLDVFRRTMNEHKGHKGQRIVFIHGKGEGVLRHALIEELKTKYRSCTYQDASFREYGFGATMVTIH